VSTIGAAHAQAGDAFDTPTLRMLNHPRAQLVAAVLATVLPPGHNRLAADLFHIKVSSTLDELRLHGVDVPDTSGRDLSREWLKALWLTTSTNDAGDEEYSLTSYAQSALEFIQRESGPRAAFGESRIRIILGAAERAADLVNPEPTSRIRTQELRVAREQAELDRLRAGGAIEAASDDQKLDALLNLQGLLAAVPGDFRRVEEALRHDRQEILGELEREQRTTGEVIDAYLERTDKLMEGSHEGRAFRGAVELLRDQQMLNRLSDYLRTILRDEFTQALTPAERTALAGTVKMIRQNLSLVLDERQRMSGQLSRTIEQHDAVRERELREVLLALDDELTTWMLTAGPRAQVPLDLALGKAEFGHLRHRFYDPIDHAPPPPLAEPRPDEDTGDFLRTAREQGGPQLAELRAALRSTPPGQRAAAMFNGLPHALRRPVEILGLMHVGKDEAAFVPESDTDTFEAIRPDGSRRVFVGPALRVRDDAHEPTDHSTVEAAP
jgi:hypothetical protein